MTQQPVGSVVVVLYIVRPSFFFLTICWLILIAVQILLDKGADVNLKDGVGNTPLHLGKLTTDSIIIYLIGFGCFIPQYEHTPIALGEGCNNNLNNGPGISSLGGQSHSYFVKDTSTGS